MSYVAMSVTEYFVENVGYYMTAPFVWHFFGSMLSGRAHALSNAIVAFWAAVFHSSSLKFSLARFGINGPKEHALHHKHGRKNYNFSLMFLHWDRLMGTYHVADEQSVETASR